MVSLEQHKLGVLQASWSMQQAHNGVTVQQWALCLWGVGRKTQEQGSIPSITSFHSSSYQTAWILVVLAVPVENLGYRFLGHSENLLLK